MIEAITEIIRHYNLGGVVIFLYFCYCLVISKARGTTEPPCGTPIKGYTTQQQPIQHLHIMECKEGIIRQVKDDRIVVLIERRSACSACHARGACLSSDKDEQLLEVTEYPLGVQVGDRVRLIPAKGGNPLKAVLFAFVIPIVLLASISIGMNMAGVSEEILLVSLVGVLLLYAGLLKLMSGYFDQTFRLRAELVK